MEEAPGTQEWAAVRPPVGAPVDPPKSPGAESSVGSLPLKSPEQSPVFPGRGPLFAPSGPPPPPVPTTPASLFSSPAEPSPPGAPALPDDGAEVQLSKAPSEEDRDWKLVSRTRPPGADGRLGLETPLQVREVLAQLWRTHVPNLGEGTRSLQALKKAVQNLLVPTAPASLQTSLRKLQSWFADTVPPRLSEQALADYALSSGIQYEGRLLAAAHGPGRAAQVAEEDLKGLLLQLLHTDLAREQSSELKLLLESAESHLKRIETQQVTHLLASEAGEGYWLEIPLGMGRDWLAAQLLISPESKEARGSDPESRGYTVLFMLDMPGLGKTRIEVYVSSQAVRASFFVEETGALEALRHELGSLSAELGTHPERAVQLEAQPLARLNPETFRKLESPVRIPAPGHFKLIDLEV